jgi:hypothetical protein
LATFSDYRQLIRDITELRNAIYEHLIDLEPSFDEAANLLWVNRQIRYEFGSLYLTQGNAMVPFNYLDSFLRVFFLSPANLVSKDVACKVCAELSSIGYAYSLDLLEVVSVMRQYPLLKHVQKFEKLASVSLHLLIMPPLYEAFDAGQVEAELDITLKKGGIIPDISDLGLEDDCWGFDVHIDMESDSEDGDEEDGSGGDEEGVNSNEDGPESNG